MNNYLITGTQINIYETIQLLIRIIATIEMKILIIMLLSCKDKVICCSIDTLIGITIKYDCLSLL